MPGAHLKPEQSLITRMFPPRQIFFRAHGDISYFTVSTTTQVALVSLLMAFSIWILFASFNTLFRDSIIESKDQAIADLEAANAKQAQDIAKLQGDIMNRADQLEARQVYLQKLMAEDPTGAIPKDELNAVPAEPLDLKDPDHEAAAASSKGGIRFGALLMGSARAATTPAISMEEFEAHVASRMEAIEAGQDQIARELAGMAETRLVEFDDMLAPFKLTALDLANATGYEFEGQGGPFVPDNDEGFSAVDESAFSLDVPFPDLSSKWNEMLKVYAGMQNIPLLAPAENFYVSSRFGRRTDPLTKDRARHYGMDLAGWPGENIFTTADGVVTKAGTWGAYGRMVEIDHGNGFTTRYGHMKKVLVTRGQTVSAGDIIGEMGCTGRCTSTHLHYEVMFNGTNRNPQPFMEAPEDVQQTQRQTNPDPDERG